MLLLERLGHSVLLADGGREALRVYAEKAAEIDLILLDLVMPDMSGKQVLVELRKANRKPRVLLSSGFTQESGGQLLKEPCVTGFLRKPFTREQLATAVDAALLDG